MSEITLAPDAPLDQVEWRVQGKIDRGNGVQVVAYLDAPTVSKLLDDWVGPDRWKDHYELTGKAGTLWCHLSVRFGDEWVTKVDLGTASETEADKGLVSDAFKRVAMRKWGVGRNVFGLPILRITKFRRVERQGKDPMAYLTGESHAEIADQLRRLGFEDAADHAAKAVATEVADEDDGSADDAPPPTEPDADHQALLVELEAALGQADSLGVAGDSVGVRQYAVTSAAHARKAIDSVREKIAAAESSGTQAGAPAAGTTPGERDASPSPAADDGTSDNNPSSGEDGTSTSPETTADPATCDHAGSIDRIGIARTRCRACGATFGAHGPNGQGVSDDGAPADAEPVETDAAWRQVCDDLGVAKTEVLNTIRKDWATNSGWNKPNRLSDVDRLAATEEFGPLVRAVIEDLHQAVPA